MSKIVVTLKEPISNGIEMVTSLIFDYVPTMQDCNGILWFKSEDEHEACAIPISNILGVAFKQESKPIEKTLE